jgi:hypothetical protein
MFHDAPPPALEPQCGLELVETVGLFLRGSLGSDEPIYGTKAVSPELQMML